MIVLVALNEVVDEVCVEYSLDDPRHKGDHHYIVPLVNPK